MLCTASRACGSEMLTSFDHRQASGRSRQPSTGPAGPEEVVHSLRTAAAGSLVADEPAATSTPLRRTAAGLLDVAHRPPAGMDTRPAVRRFAAVGRCSPRVDRARGSPGWAGPAVGEHRRVRPAAIATAAAGDPRRAGRRSAHLGRDAAASRLLGSHGPQPEPIAEQDVERVRPAVPEPGRTFLRPLGDRRPSLDRLRPRGRDHPRSGARPGRTTRSSRSTTPVWTPPSPPRARSSRSSPDEPIPSGQTGDRLAVLPDRTRSGDDHPCHLRRQPDVGPGGQRLTVAPLPPGVECASR